MSRKVPTRIKRKSKDKLYFLTLAALNVVRTRML